MKEKNDKKLFSIIYAAFLLSALSVTLLPVAFDETEHLSMAGYIAGGMFWVGMLIGIIGYVMFFAKKYGKPDVLKLFRNVPATVADVVLVLSVIGTVYCSMHFNANQWVAEITLFLLILSVYSHFLLNGKVFEHIYGRNKEKESGKKE